MPEKRKPSTRLRNDRLKRKASTPAEETPPNETQESEPEEEPLPTEIDEDGPLPTILSGMSLGEQSTKSIPESGVLAASMGRSHQVWITENLFEHYWTKPYKRKGKLIEPPNNPTDKMTKLGTCRIIIEPHILDATVYGIKQPTVSNPTNAAKNPIMQYNPPAINSGNFQAPPAASPQPPKANPQIQQHSQTSSKSAAPTPPAQPAATPSQLTAPRTNPTQTKSPVVKVERPPTQPAAASPSTTTPTPTPTPQQPPKPQNTDPVIQMLAQRASTNPELKLLMKIVASGSASGEQLRTFQDHIDSIKEMIKKEGSNPKSPTPQQQQNQPPPPQPIRQTPMQTNLAPPRPPAPSQPTKFVSSGYQQTTFSASPHPKPTPQKVPKNEVVTVVIEFNEPGASGDRHLFPRHSILEFRPGNREIVASFLLVRKPNEGSSARYKSSEEYYQPVTLTISSDSPKVLESIGRYVAPAEEVRRHMVDVMSKKKRAEHVHLLLQLPVDTDEMEVDSSNRSTPVRSGTSKVTERKSMAKSAATNALGINAAAPESDDKINTWQARHCQFCLKMVPSTAMKEDGGPVCEPCHNLRRMDRLRNPFDAKVPAQLLHTAREPLHYSGQQTLSI